MPAYRRGIRVRSLLLLLLLGATPATGLVQESAPQGRVAPEVSTVPSPSGPAEPVGSGIWERAGCILCASAFLAAGGTSILGVAVTAIAFPELAAACGLTCAYAFG